MMTTDNFRVVVDTDLSELNEDKTMYSKVVFQSAQMNLMTPVIKLTIPEELKVKQITFKAYNIKEGTSTPLEICGKFTMTMRGRIVTRYPSDIYGTTDTNKKNYEEIIIRRNDSNDNKELIFGDVYITILPDLVKDTAMGTTSSAKELYFKFQTTLNEADVNYKYVEVRQPITNTLTAGKVLDLGTVPTNLEFIAPNASSQASVNFSGTVPSTTPAE